MANPGLPREPHDVAIMLGEALDGMQPEIEDVGWSDDPMGRYAFTCDGRRYLVTLVEVDDD